MTYPPRGAPRTFTDEQEAEIYDLYMKGRRQTTGRFSVNRHQGLWTWEKLARKYHTSDTTIGNVIKREKARRGSQ